MIEINSRDEIPNFENEAEEHEFWATHSFGERLLEEFGPRPRMDRPSLDVEEGLAKRLIALADAKGVGYRASPRQFLAERIREEEKREGIVK